MWNFFGYWCTILRSSVMVKIHVIIMLPNIILIPSDGVEDVETCPMDNFKPQTKIAQHVHHPQLSAAHRCRINLLP